MIDESSGNVSSWCPKNISLTSTGAKKFLDSPVGRVCAEYQINVPNSALTSPLSLLLCVIQVSAGSTVVTVSGSVLCSNH